MKVLINYLRRERMAKLRTSSLKIGRVIHSNLKDIIRIFPIIADKGITGDFAVYRRTSLTPSDTKDLYNFEEVAYMDVIVVSANYNDSLELAQAVKIRMESVTGSFETDKEEAIIIDKIEMINASEDWQNDAYIQRLTFKINIEKECC